MNNIRIFVQLSCFVFGLISWNASFAKPHDGQNSFFDSLSQSSELDSEALEPKITEPLPVEQAFQPFIEYVPPNAETPGFFRISWTVEKGYYLYQERFKAKITPNENTQIGAIRYSKSGIIKSDPDFGDVEVYKSDVELIIPVHSENSQSVELRLDYMGCMENVLCYPPKHLKESFLLTGGGPGVHAIEGTTANPSETSLPTNNKRTLSNESAAAEAASLSNSAQTEKLNSTNTEKLLAEGSLFLIGLTFFGLGLLMAFTACVYPMVPILSSIIVGQGETITKKRAFALSFTYVQAVAITYGLGGIAGAQLGENITNTLQTPWILIGSAALFVVLAFSMFGFFTIQLPTSLQDRLDALNRKQKSGSFIGAFLMGVFSGLVVSPCVAPPLIAALAYAAATGEVVRGGFALYALGFGMGAPLLLIGILGGKVLPAAGAWMDGIKCFFGVLLLGVAISMLERFIPSQLTLTLWGAWFIIPAIYLGALEPAQSNWSKFRKGVGIVMVICGASLIIGALKGNENPLRPLESKFGGPNPTAYSSAPQWNKVSTMDQLTSTLQNSNTPTMVDFYADWCIECKIMERDVFSDAHIQSLLSEFQMVKIDVTQMNDNDVAIMQSFNLFGPPAILFFDNKGEELAAQRTIGGQSVTEFSNTLSKIIETPE